MSNNDNEYEIKITVATLLPNLFDAVSTIAKCNYSISNNAAVADIRISDCAFVFFSSQQDNNPATAQI
jgi:hypothetical protein